MNNRKKLLCIFILVFLFFFITRAFSHYNLKTDYYDEYFFDNPFWNTAQGHPLFLSVEKRSFMGNHFSPLLFVFSLPYFIYPSPLWVFALQALLMAGIIILILLFAQKQLDNREDQLLLFLLLTNASLRYMGINDFHMDIVMAFLLTAALYLLFMRQNIFWATALMLSCFLAKETAGLLIAGFGLFLIVKKKPVWGLGLMFFGLAGTILLVKKVIPFFNPSEGFKFSNYYSHLGGNITEQAAFLFFHPIKSMAFILTGQNLLYLILLFAPLGFLPLFSPSTLLIGLAYLAQNLLSDYRFQKDITTQYTAVLVPILFFAAIMGIRNLGQRGQWEKYLKRIRPIILFFAVISVLAFFLLQARLYVPSSKTFSAHRIMTLIPKAASVSASTHLLVHLQYRTDLYIFPTINNADYVIFEDIDRWLPVAEKDYDRCLKDLWSNNKPRFFQYFLLGETTTCPVSKAEYAQAINQLQNNPVYTLVTQESGIFLYERVTVRAVTPY